MAGNRLDEPGPEAESFEILFRDQFVLCQLPDPEFLILGLDIVRLAVIGETMEDKNAPDLLSLKGFQHVWW